MNSTEIQYMKNVTLELTIREANALAKVADNGWGNGDWVSCCTDGGRATRGARRKLDKAIKQYYAIKKYNQHMERSPSKSPSSEKVAKLVEVAFVTRVIVDADATDDRIIATAKEHIRSKYDLEFEENIVSIEDDTECPFGTLDTDDIS